MEQKSFSCENLEIERCSLKLRQKKKSNMTTEAETGVMRPGAKEYRQQCNVGEARKKFSRTHNGDKSMGIWISVSKSRFAISGFLY